MSGEASGIGNHAYRAFPLLFAGLARATNRSLRWVAWFSVTKSSSQQRPKSAAFGEFLLDRQAFSICSTLLAGQAQSARARVRAVNSRC